MALAGFALTLASPTPSLSILPRLSHSPAPIPCSIPTALRFLCRSSPLGLPQHSSCPGADDASFQKFLDTEALRRLSRMGDAGEVLSSLSEMGRSGGGCARLEPSDCNAIISAALDEGNVDLALSVFDAMRSGNIRDGVDKGSAVVKCRWAWPDAQTYVLLITRLAVMLRVSDALKIITCAAHMGVSLSAEEVRFGIVVRCPTCMVAIAVAQPQHGIQVTSCSKCRYQYELVSGNIVKIESEEISVDLSTWEKALRLLSILKDDLPAAVHSVVVSLPTGTSRTNKFATKTVEMPAQEGERVTICLAAPPNVYNTIGPLKMGPRNAGFRPSQPICLTNHSNGQVSPLLRAPPTSRVPLLLNPIIFLSSIALFASRDALSSFIDPSLANFASMALIASVTIGTTFDQVVLPELRKLPPKSVEAVAVRQLLLSQYDMLQSRISHLKGSIEKEVLMLARMSQLENKIMAVGELSYRARRDRIKKVIGSLESALRSRIKLMESFAKLSSMIEIEVEMESDVLLAESVSSAEIISEQIEQLMEMESLEEQWRIQAEANDEAERLLSSDALSSEWYHFFYQATAATEVAMATVVAGVAMAVAAAATMATTDATNMCSSPLTATTMVVTMTEVTAGAGITAEATATTLCPDRYHRQ